MFPQQINPYFTTRAALRAGNAVIQPANPAQPLVAEQPVSQPVVQPQASQQTPSPLLTLSPEDEQSYLGWMGTQSLSGLAAAGNFLDLATGASSIRDVITGNNPFDQFLTPLSDVNRTTGRGVLSTWNLASENDPTRWELADLAGFGTEVLLDPFAWPASWLKGGRALGAAADAASSARKFDLPVAFSGPSIGGNAARKAYSAASSAVPQSWKESIKKSAPVQGAASAADWAKRHVQAAFDQEVLQQTDPVNQKMARSMSRAADEAGRESRDAMRATRQAFSELDAEFGQSLSPDILNAARELPPLIDERDIRQVAKQIYDVETGNQQGVFDEIRNWKASNIGLANQARAAHNAGRDWSSINRWDEIADELRSSILGYEAGGGIHFNPADHPELSDERLWDYLIGRRDVPKVEDFFHLAEERISNSINSGSYSELNPETFQGINGFIVRTGPVEVRKPLINRQYGEYTDEMADLLGEVPDHATGWLVKPGTRESYVMFRGNKGNLDIKPIPNKLIGGVTDPKIAAARAQDFSTKVLSDLERYVAENATLDPDAMGTGIAEMFAKYAGLGEDQIDFSRYERLAQKLQNAFGGGTGPESVGVGSRVQWVSGGSDQFREPKIVSEILDGPDGQQWARFQDEPTAVPLSQLENVGGAPGQIKGVLRELKDKPYDDLYSAGLDVKKHVAGAADDMFDTDHWPRYLTKIQREELSKQGVTPRQANLYFASMKARNPALRDIDAHVLNELYINSRYRGKNAADNIMEDYGHLLDEQFGANPPGESLGGMADNAVNESISEIDTPSHPDLFDFNPRELDAAPTPGDAIPGRRGHAEAIADSIASHHRGELFSRIMAADTESYLKGAYRTKAAVYGLHEFLNSAAIEQAAKAADATADATSRTMKLSEVYDKIGNFAPERVKEFYQQKYGVSPDDFDKLEVPIEYANAAGAYGNIINPEKILNGPLLESIADIVGSFNQWWKTNLTAPFPAFHARNRVSGVVANLLIGNANPARYFLSNRRINTLVKNAAAGNLTKEESDLLELAFRYNVIDPKHAGYGVEHAPSSIDGITNPIDMVPPPMFGKRTAIHSGDMVRMPESGEFGHVVEISGDTATVRVRDADTGIESITTVPVNQLSPEGGRFVPSHQEALDRVNANPVHPLFSLLARLPGATKARVLGEQIIGAGTNMGRLAEFHNRMEMFDYLLRSGMSPEDAAKRVEQLHFDYSKGTQFENEILKKAFPFYTFTRRMSELTARTLYEHPGGPLAQAIRGTRLATQDKDNRGLPDYIASTTSIPLGELDDGSRRYLTGLGLAHEDPLSFLSSDRKSGMPSASGFIGELLSRTTPLIKVPIELATGESLFQRGPMGGRDLIDMDPTLGRTVSNISETLGLGKWESPSGRANPVIGDTFEMLFANSPYSRYASTLRTLTDHRKREAAFAVPGDALVTNLLTGARVTDVSPASQDAVTREYAQAYAREHLGAKHFESVRVPKEVIEEAAKSDPERARQMQVINRMQRIFQKRREERESRAETRSLPPGT